MANWLSVCDQINSTFRGRIDRETNVKNLWSEFDRITELTVELGYDLNEVDRLSLKQRYIVERLFELSTVSTS